MSGRIAPDRVGYIGYTCDPITPIAVDCVDCDSNYYGTIPISFSGVTSNTAWHDYQDGNIPSESVPTSFARVCSDSYTQGFLEVEYPDVPPVTVRGISLYNRSANIPKPLEVCTLCWEYDRTDPDDVRAFYYDIDDVKVSPTGDEFQEPANPQTYIKTDLSPDYLLECTDQYPDDDPYASITFIHCPCKDNIITRQVLTNVWIDTTATPKTLSYRYEEWKFDGNRLIEINDLGVCENDEATINTEAALAAWKTDIVDVTDCP